MGAISQRPLFTAEFERSELFVPDPQAVYFFGVSSEPRSLFAKDLIARNSSVKFVELSEGPEHSIRSASAGFEELLPRERTRLSSFIASFGSRTVYIDITGLEHRVWAPIVRVCIEAHYCVRVVYLEPTSYNVASSPEAGEIFDLSELVDGISPIPLFANFHAADDNSALFVPLLGFEGVRLSHMINELEPTPERIVPVIGVPGFQMHFPFHTYTTNASVLQNYSLGRQIRLARSNCPFSLFYLLEDIDNIFPGAFMRVGLIGTKPHALGAILYAMAHPESVEIVYDHAKRKASRSTGTTRCLVYGVSDFLTPDRRPHS